MNTPKKIESHFYDTRKDLAQALALSVAGILAGGIATRGYAVLAVSGGSTPKLFFDILSRADIEWSNITIILVDERIVPLDNERSNAKLVLDHLMRNKASDANLVSYAVDCADPDTCAVESTKRFALHAAHIDALILGMGLDGHTASFFPKGDNLDDALNLEGQSKVLAIKAEGAGEPRLTLTLPIILDARFIALHIEGDAKKQALEQALAGKDINEMPVRAVLENAVSPINLFWAP